jgi:DNA-binding transcriptional LysR family regulator
MRRGRSRSGAGASETPGEPPSAGETNIPTDLLRTFVAVHDMGSFTKAAHLLALTQPAVSAQMRRLEAIIGDDLIDKNLTGVRLTESGDEVLRHARRILAINDQMVSCAGQQPSLQVIRLGLPNIYAPVKLARLVEHCAAAAGDAHIQLRCDHSGALTRNVRSDYLDLACVMGDDEEMWPVLATWSEKLAWVKAAGFTYERGGVVPLVSSPNLLPIDRAAMATLDHAGLRYDIAFTAFDTLARCAASGAGLGYFAIPAGCVPPPLIIEEDGVLPALPDVTLRIIARADLDTQARAPLIEAFRIVMSTPA